MAYAYYCGAVSNDWKTKERELNAVYMAELRAAIARAGLSDTQAAKRAGVHQTAMSRWLRNDSVMTAQRFVQIATAIGADPIKLFADATDEATRRGLLSGVQAVVAEDELPEQRGGADS